MRKQSTRLFTVKSASTFEFHGSSPSALTTKQKDTRRCLFVLAGAEGFEPSARGFGAKYSTLSVKPRVKIQSPHKIRIKTALSGFESAVRFCFYSFC